jgi:hypothetical protein
MTRHAQRSAAIKPKLKAAAADAPAPKATRKKKSAAG